MRTTGRYTAEDGTRIWYRIQGSGPPMVLCDGVGCDGYVWPYVMDHFEESFTIIRWHYRGHGNSDEPADPEALTIGHMCQDMHGILEHLRQNGTIDAPTMLVGHSMGCQVILEYAHRYPAEVRGLVPICGSYGRPLDTFQESSDGRAGISPIKIFIEKMIQLVESHPDLVNAVWTMGFNSPLSWPLASRTEVNAELVRRVEFMPYLRHMGRIKAQTFLRTLRHAAEHTTEEYLDNLDVPSLVVAAKNDRFTPMRLSEEMSQRLPDASLVVLPEGTHTAPLEQPELLIEFMEDFIASLKSS